MAVGLGLLAWLFFDLPRGRLKPNRDEFRTFCYLLPLALGVFWGILISDNLQLGFREGRSALMLLLLPFLSAYFRPLRGVPLAWLGLGILLVEFSFAAHRASIVGIEHRWGGTVYTGTDGYFSSVFALWFLVLFLKKRERLASGTGFLLAVVFMGLTQSRGPILFSMLLLPLILFLESRHKTKILLLVVFFIAAFFVFLPERASKRILNIPQTFMGQRDVSTSSIGTRLELWSAGLRAAKETRGMGTGYGDFKSDLNRYQKTGVMPEVNTKLHLHSIYLHSLMCAGIPGLTGLLVTLFLFILWKATVYFRRHSIEALGHLMLLSHLALNGLFDAHLEDGQKVYLFSFFWILFSLSFPPSDSSLLFRDSRQ